MSNKHRRKAERVQRFTHPAPRSASRNPGAPVNMAAVCRMLHIARHARFEKQNHLVGKVVRISSKTSIQNDLTKALDPLLPRGYELAHSPSDHLKALQKYGLINLEFTLPIDNASRLKRLTLDELRALQLVQADEAPGDDNPCLEVMMEEIASREIFLKIMLHATDDGRTVDERLRHVERGLPATYLPRTFEITDAAITNIPTVWLSLHFYM